MWWKRAIPVAVAIILIIIIGTTSYRSYVKETYGDSKGNVTREDYLRFLPKYRYSDDVMELHEYYTIFADDEVPIVYESEVTTDRGYIKDGYVYMDLATIEEYFSDRYYYNEKEHNLLYTTATSVFKTLTDGKSMIETEPVQEGEEAVATYGYSVNGTFCETEYEVAYEEDGTVYVALDYLRKFDAFTYELLEDPYRMIIRTQNEYYQTVTVTEDTQVRYRGGIKSDILKEVQIGETLILMETLENWSRVMTEDALIGYIENDCIEASDRALTYTVDPAEYEDGYAPITLDHKVSMVFHQLWAAQGGSDLKSAMSGVSGVNVVCPTWFRFKDNEGSVTNLSNKNYVDKAHELGLQVWAMLTDLDTEDIDLYTILSSSEARAAIIDTMVSTVVECGADGINVDVENVKTASGEHFVQFLRELSIRTHEEGIILSVDNYYPTESSKYYDYAEQGTVCDYLVMMGYDEHWSGSGSAGSVASITFVRDGLSSVLEMVDASQVINAVPFYTRVWYTSDSKTTDETLSMANTGEWLSGRGYTVVWDDATGQNYVDFDNGNTRIQCWLEDEDSLRLKMQVMDNKQIAGVAAWKLGQQDPDIWTLFEEYLASEE